jgi:hypothetical protein
MITACTPDPDTFSGKLQDPDTHRDQCGSGTIHYTYTIKVIRSYRVSTGTRTLKNKMMLANLRTTTRILDAQNFLLLHNFWRVRMLL